MSRSGYSDDCENLGLWRQAVNRAITGKRGQAFLTELLAALDAMPDKRLITESLESEGCFCTLGVIGNARGMDMSDIDYEDAEEVGKVFGISQAMAAEIEFMNDEMGFSYELRRQETEEERWTRMREWVAKSLIHEPF